MQYTGYGRVVKSVGGLFFVRLFTKESAFFPQDQPASPLDGFTVPTRARGNLHRRGEVLVGDLVRLEFDDSSFKIEDGRALPSPDGTGTVIAEILPRSSALIRPPMANLDVLFVTVAAATPDPVLSTVDKLIAIAEYHRITPVVVITKSDLNQAYASRLKELYGGAGFETFLLGKDLKDCRTALRTYLEQNLTGKIAAFSGASGVGKSTLLNTLFPSLELEVGEISRRIERGKNTTRAVTLYPLSESTDAPLIADTPGFTMLDFERFDFFDKEDLAGTFREFDRYIGACKYTKCSHTKEDGCAILQAVKEGKIAKSRHQSYCELWEILKKKTKWDK